MRGLSLRTRTLLVSTMVAVAIAGGAWLVTYAATTDSIRMAARRSAERVAKTAEGALRQHAESALAREDTLEGLDVAFARADIADAGIALYDENLSAIWSSSPRAILLGEEDGRSEAITSGSIVIEEGNTSVPWTGLLRDVRLDEVVVHVPTELPNGEKVVLDVIYAPVAEAEIINGIRWLALGRAFLSTLLLVVVMQVSMMRVLALVDDLRKGADSIDAGRLDERLPVKGNDEIAALARSLNGLIDRLERRSDAQARFVADASHELATPVAGIRGYTNILRAWGADDPRVHDEAVDAIDRESRRMARLTGDLLNLLHADQGIVLKTERFDLNALARGQLALSASRWLEKNIEYVGPDEAPLLMQGDPDRIVDVLSILLDNASKYTPSGGSIVVTTRRRRDNVTLEVSDTGPGIPPHDLEHVFERFYRTELSRAAGEGGFGLGLAIAKSIVLSMGGEISATSVVGQGTRFVMKLQRRRA